MIKHLNTHSCIHIMQVTYMNRNEKRAMVAIKPETREKLMMVGRKGETYDYIINKLITEYENNGSKNRN